jgi:hypothetical protein
MSHSRNKESSLPFARSLEEKLNQILSLYPSVNKGKAFKELKFPPSERWRFFVEIHRQNFGGYYLKKISEQYQKILIHVEKRALQELEIEKEEKEEKFEKIKEQLKKAEYNLNIAQYHLQALQVQQMSEIENPETEELIEEAEEKTKDLRDRLEQKEQAKYDLIQVEIEKHRKKLTEIQESILTEKNLTLLEQLKKEKQEIEQYLTEKNASQKNMLEYILNGPIDQAIDLIRLQLQQLIEPSNSFFRTIEHYDLYNECLSIAENLKKFSIRFKSKEYKGKELTFKQLLEYSQGWLFFELTEPGCVKAFCETINLIGKDHNEIHNDAKRYAKYQIKIIKKFHYKVIEGVSGDIIRDNEMEEKSVFRFRNNQYAKFDILSKESKSAAYNISPEGQLETQNRLLILTKQFPFYLPVMTYQQKNCKSFVSVIDSNKLEVENKIEEIMSFLLEEYFENAKKTTDPLSKLKLIISLIRDLEQLHPFNDANCRTLCILYFNHLLLLNGFPPSILPNANRFDGCSIDELLSDTIEGMENTFNILQGKAIAGIATNDIMVFLKDNGYHQAFQYAEKHILSSSLPMGEKKYIEALTALKRYIEIHEWTVSLAGGKAIEIQKENGEKISKKVPTTVFLQWQAILNKEQKLTPQSIYNKVIEIALDSDVRYKPGFLFRRAEDSIAYINQFWHIDSPEDMRRIFTVDHLKSHPLKPLYPP